MKMNVVVQIILGALLLYAAYCCLLFLFQRQVLFPRHHIGAPLGIAKGISGLERIWLNTRGGKVEAWFLPTTTDREGQPAPAVIFAHGNAELIDFWPHEFSPVTALGIGVLLVEYPGYGRSEGSPTQKNITEAFVAAYDALVARKDVDPSRIILLGRSLGGGAVCALAAKRSSAALVLLSTFTSLRDCASQFLVPGFFVRDPFDNLAVVRSYAGPVLVMHGKNDNLIPYRHGVSLFRAAKHGKMLTYDCRHNDCPPSWHTFWNDVGSFLKEAGIIRPFP
jgi:fermentation-respiration switch protein FrsA (DUF1100 family)